MHAAAGLKPDPTGGRPPHDSVRPGALQGPWGVFAFPAGHPEGGLPSGALRAVGGQVREWCPAGPVVGGGCRRPTAPPTSAPALLPPVNENPSGSNGNVNLDFT